MRVALSNWIARKGCESSGEVATQRGSSAKTWAPTRSNCNDDAGRRDRVRATTQLAVGEGCPAGTIPEQVAYASEERRRACQMRGATDSPRRAGVGVRRSPGGAMCGSERQSRASEAANDDGRHDCRLSENAWHLNGRNTHGVLGSHSAVLLRVELIDISRL